MFASPSSRSKSTELLFVAALAWRCKHLCNQDRKSTRLNSSHTVISYAVFCLKKKTELHQPDIANPQISNYASLHDACRISAPRYRSHSEWDDDCLAHAN